MSFFWKSACGRTGSTGGHVRGLVPLYVLVVSGGSVTEDHKVGVAGGVS